MTLKWFFFPPRLHGRPLRILGCALPRGRIEGEVELSWESGFITFLCFFLCDGRMKLKFHRRNKFTFLLGGFNTNDGLDCSEHEYENSMWVKQQYTMLVHSNKIPYIELDCSHGLIQKLDWSYQSNRVRIQSYTTEISCPILDWSLLNAD